MSVQMKCVLIVLLVQLVSIQVVIASSVSDVVLASIVMLLPHLAPYVQLVNIQSL